MAFKASSIHWEIIIDFMEQHKDLARGFITGPLGKDKAKKLWEELTMTLNSAGLGERPTKKWQKTWIDFKHLLKKKAGNIKGEIHATGGGPSELVNLSPIENRVLCILGPTFYKGIGRPENGCTFGTSLKPLDNPQIVGPSKMDPPSLPTQSHEDNSSGSTSIVKKMVSAVETPETVTLKRRINQDHDYEKTPRQSVPKKLKNKQNEPVEVMYRETLNELRDIKFSLQHLEECGRGILAALQQIADTISNN